MKNAITGAINATRIDWQGGQPPEWTELVPAGDVVGRDGRRWINTNPAAILQAFQRHGADLPVDVEHATELKAPKGEPAPAVGWVDKLENRSGAVWGRIAWTMTGRNLIASRQYRYLSPVILFSKSDGQIAALSSVALTNRPNLHLGALNARDDPEDPLPLGLTDDERTICQRMGVAEEDYAKVKAAEASTLASALSADERKICRLMGIAEEDFLQTKNR